VPFDSGAEIKAAILGGHITGAVEELAETLPLIEAGKLKSLCVIMEKRHPALPNVPCSKELGRHEANAGATERADRPVHGRQARPAGAQGLGGLSTVLDVKIRTYPAHAANRPVAMIPNCAATRHAHFVLDGSGPAEFEAPKLSDWPAVTWQPDSSSKKVSLDTLTREEVASWKPGQRLLLSGKLLTGRDAAHKRIQDMLAKGEKLPVDFTNRVIYYVGPVDPVRDEVVGPAGPTTATRMDKFTETMLGKTGLIAMIGKAERGPAAIESIRKHRGAYLMAVGGAAYLVAKAIRKSRVLAFEDLGMEAIYEFEVKEMPVTVAVDAKGTSVHTTGPAEWSKKIIELKLPVTAA